MKRKYLITFLSSYKNPSSEHYLICESLEDLEKQLDDLENDSNVYNINIKPIYE